MGESRDPVAEIALQTLMKQFGTVTAVNQLDLTVGSGELVGFLGPSGCGKTTTLRMIAGFETPTSGRIVLGDRDVTDLPPEQRNLGMVFQNYALFPHLTARQNVAFGLEMRGMKRGEIKERTSTILQKVGLEGKEDRYPRQLSGGEQQRTALARALVIEPSVLLLDEPLANLDAKLREEMRFYIRSLQQEYGITTIYVTHDQDEALVLADRIAVLMDGSLQQLGAPEELYRRPRTVRVASFVGLANLLPVTVAEREGEMLRLESAHGPLHAYGPVLPPGTRAVLSVRPEGLHLATTEQHANCFRGSIKERAFLGNLIDYRVAIGDETLRVQGAANDPFRTGDRVSVSFAPDDAWVIPVEA